MSRYTITVHELIQNNFDFGLNEYPIFDENYREVLNTAILDFYRFKEICYSNPIRWRYELQARMNRIMRNKYNKLYESKMIEFNPLYNIEIIETFQRELNNETVNQTNGTSNNTSNGNNVSKSVADNQTLGENMSVSAQYPTEQMLANQLNGTGYVDGSGKITQKGSDNTTTDNTATFDSIDNATYGNESNGQSKDNENYVKKTVGSSAGLPFSKAMIQLKEYIDKFQLDEQVIDELADLFITIHREEEY